jgi:hypothetical protein
MKKNIEIYNKKNIVLLGKNGMKYLTTEEWTNYYLKNPEALSQYINAVNNEFEKILNKNEKLMELLRFALHNLTYTNNYPDVNSEFGHCIVCNQPDYDHSDDCKAEQWKNEVKDLFTRQ